MFSLINYGCSSITKPDEYLNLIANEERLIIRVLVEYQQTDTPVVINDEEDLYTVDSYLISTTTYNSLEVVLFHYKDKVLQLVYESYIDKSTDLEFEWRLNEKIYVFKPKSDVTDTRYKGNAFAVNVVPFTHFYNRKPRAINKIFISCLPMMVGFIRMYPLQGYERMDTVPKLIKINSKDKFITNLQNLKYEHVSDPIHPLNDEFQNATTIQYDFDIPATCTPNQEVTVGVKAHFVNGQPYPVNQTYVVEALSGYVPNRAVKLINGEGSFRIKATDLKPGESLSVIWRDGLFERGSFTIPVIQ